MESSTEKESLKDQSYGVLVETASREHDLAKVADILAKIMRQNREIESMIVSV